MTYNREAIQRWFEMGHNTCPITRRRVVRDCFPNLLVRSDIVEWLHHQGRDVEVLLEIRNTTHTHVTQADEMVRSCTAAEAAARAGAANPPHRPIPLDVSALQDQLGHVRAQHARLQAHQRNLAEQLAALPPLYTELHDIVPAMARGIECIVV